MNDRQKNQLEYGRRAKAHLDRNKAKGIEVGKMSDSQLWLMLDRQLAIALDKGEAWEAREAFYAACRAKLCANELFLRGQQLALIDPAAYFKAPDFPD